MMGSYHNTAAASVRYRICRGGEGTRLAASNHKRGRDCQPPVKGWSANAVSHRVHAPCVRNDPFHSFAHYGYGTHLCAIIASCLCRGSRKI